MMHYLRIGKKPALLLRPLKAILKIEVDRLSLQKLEYEMDHADLPDDYVFKDRILWSPCLTLRTYSTRSSH